MPDIGCMLNMDKRIMWGKIKDTHDAQGVSERETPLHNSNAACAVVCVPPMRLGAQSLREAEGPSQNIPVHMFI